MQKRRQDAKPRPILFSGLNTICTLNNKQCCQSSFLCSSQELQRTVVGLVSPHPDQTQPGLEAMFLKSQLGNDDVFLSACIVMMFNTIVVKHKKALKTQLTTSVKCTPLALAIFAKDPDQCSVSSVTMQRNFIALEESSVFE